MGEKEQGAAGESSAPSVSERDAQSGKAGGITGDPDFDRARASTVKSSKSNSSESLASGGLPPDAASDEGEDGDAARVIGQNLIHHNRGAAMTHEDDWTSPASGMAGDPGDSQRSGPIRLDSTPARISEGGGSDIAIGDPGVNGN